jgi:hypothetical protein
LEGWKVGRLEGWKVGRLEVEEEEFLVSGSRFLVEDE